MTYTLLFVLPGWNNIDKAVGRAAKLLLIISYCWKTVVQYVIHCQFGSFGDLELMLSTGCATTCRKNVFLIPSNGESVLDPSTQIDAQNTSHFFFLIIANATHFLFKLSWWGYVIKHEWREIVILFNFFHCYVLHYILLLSPMKFQFFWDLFWVLRNYDFTGTCFEFYGVLINGIALVLSPIKFLKKCPKHRKIK